MKPANPKGKMCKCRRTNECTNVAQSVAVRVAVRVPFFDGDISHHARSRVGTLWAGLAAAIDGIARACGCSHWA